MKTHIAIASAAQCCLAETGQDARPDPVCIITMAQLLHTTYTRDAADFSREVCQHSTDRALENDWLVGKLILSFEIFHRKVSSSVYGVALQPAFLQLGFGTVPRLV